MENSKLKTGLIDSHAHLDMAEFTDDLPQVLERAKAAGVDTIISVATDIKSSLLAISLAKKCANIFASAGIHPHLSAEITEADMAKLAELAKEPKVIAIGETGLDFYRDYAPQKAQISVFKKQLELSVATNLPLIIHCRKAEEALLPVLSQWAASVDKDEKGAIHCFSGNAEAAAQYLEMGFLLALGGYISYPSAEKTHDIIRSIPSDKLLVETDCPFLPHQAHRGQRNEPAYMALTVETLASIRGVSEEEIRQQTAANTRRLFRLG